MKTYLIAALSISVSLAVQAGHHEAADMKNATVVGTVYSDDGTPSQSLARNTDKQKIWVDYIQAYDDKDSDGITEISTDDWEGFFPDGAVIKGNTTHIAFLKYWFLSSENSKCKPI